MTKRKKVRRKKVDKEFWLKRGLIMILAVSLVNMLLLSWLLMAISSSPKTVALLKKKSQAGVSGVNDEEKFDQYQAGEVISKAGYEIRFSNPRYEFDEQRSLPVFKVEVMMENHSFQPYISTGGNCDIAKDGVIVRNGAGVSLSELRDVYPGERLSWGITVLLTTGSDRDDGDHEAGIDHGYTVPSCVYAPQGSYDPKISAKIVF